MYADVQPGMWPWHAAITLLAFAWGTCVGSYLNVCIYRIPHDMSTVAPRSHCPCCRRLIPWYCNVPLVSFAALGARCKYCLTRISPRYFLVELLVGCLFLLVWFRLDLRAAPPLGLVPMQDWKLVPVYWLFLSGLVLATFVDFDHLIIPDRVTLGGIPTGLLLSVLAPSLQGADSALTALGRSAAGAAVGWGILWAVALAGRLIFRREAMGFGDVKLMGAIGAFLGWRGVLFTLVVSSLCGSLIGVSLVLLQRRGMRSRIPYGPYLALAALLWVLWGPRFWDAYVGLLVADTGL